MFVGSVDQERKAYIHLLLYPHGSDITSQDTKYVQSITIYTGFTRSHALHQSAPSSSPGRGIPLRCTRSLLLGPLLVTARNGAVNHPSLYSHITQLMLYALLHISLTPPHFKCRGFRGGCNLVERGHMVSCYILSFICKYIDQMHTTIDINVTVKQF